MELNLEIKTHGKCCRCFSSFLFGVLALYFSRKTSFFLTKRQLLRETAIVCCHITFDNQAIRSKSVWTTFKGRWPRHEQIYTASNGWLLITVRLSSLWQAFSGLSKLGRVIEWFCRLWSIIFLKFLTLTSFTIKWWTNFYYRCPVFNLAVAGFGNKRSQKKKSALLASSVVADRKREVK